MTEQNFVDQKIKELIKNGYKRNQAYLVAKSMYTKQYAQQAINPFAQPTINPMWSTPTYTKKPNTNAYGFPITTASSSAGVPQSTPQQAPSTQVVATTQSFQKPPMYDTSNEEIILPVNTNPSMYGYEESMAGATLTSYGEQLRQGGIDAVTPQTEQERQFANMMISQNNVDKKQLDNQRNEVNIYNPFSGVSLDDSLRYAGQGFGEKDPFKAGIGTSLSLLKGARGFLSGYANGTESRRVAKQNEDTLYNQNRNYIYQQQGGKKITNAENLTGQFIIDEGNGVNMENDEFVKRATGQVQQVVGEPHVRNGKEAEGVDVNLEDGDKTLSNTKILPIGAKNAKELKDRYNISVKAKDTFASVQKKVDSKIGYKKETEELASWIEKFGENERLKDKTTKELNAPIIEKNMIASKAKIEALNDVRGMVFEDLFERQEMLPKKGNPGDLFTDSGKLVTEKNEGVAQQGGEQQDQASQIILAYAEASGQDPQALMEQIGQMQPEEQQQALQQMAQELQSGQEQGESTEEEQQEMQQQGGLMEMASKYGIPLDRAQELISMQQGGNFNYQKTGDINIGEKDIANINKSTGIEFTPEFSQAYFSNQSAPIIQQTKTDFLTQPIIDITSDGQFTNRKVWRTQRPEWFVGKKEPVEGEDYTTVPYSKWKSYQKSPEYDAYTNKGQIASLQQGGEKDYYQSAGEYSAKQQKERLGDYYTHVSGLGYTGAKDIGKMQNWMAENYPQEVTDYFIKNGQPLTAKHVDIIKNKYKNVFKDTGISPSKKSEDYTAEEKLKLQTALGEKANQEFLLDGFKDNKWDWRFPMVGTNLQARGLTNAPQAPITTTDMSKFYSTPTEVAPQTEIFTQKEKPTVDENGVKTYMPSFPVDLRMPPSALAALNKPYVPFGRQEAIKATAEPMLAEQERLRQVDLERINQTGLSPQQMEALSASGLASSQMAANDAIGKVENFNAQNQFQTDQFNIGQRTKEDTINAQFSQKYQDQMLGSMDAYERNWRNYYTEGNLQNRMNYNDVENANLLNAKNEQYAVIPGQGVIFKNNQSQDMPISMPSTQKAFDDMTAEERWNLLNNFNKKADAMKKYKSSTT